MRFFTEMFMSVVVLIVALAVNAELDPSLQKTLWVSGFSALGLMFAYAGFWESTNQHPVAAFIATFMVLLWVLDVLLRIPAVASEIEQTLPQAAPGEIGGIVFNLFVQYSPALYGAIVLAIIVGVMIQSLALWREVEKHGSKRR